VKGALRELLDGAVSKRHRLIGLLQSPRDDGAAVLPRGRRAMSPQAKGAPASADRSLDLRRWRRWAQGVSLLMVLSGLLVAAVWWLNRVERKAWADSGPEEGYWTVAQYQIAFGRLREELRVAASGGNVEAAMLDLRVDILQSRTNILTERSELTTYYGTIKGYREAADRLAAFGQTVLPLVARAARDPARAAALLSTFDEHEATVLSLVNEVRLEEVRTRELSLEGILVRRRVVITILGIAWVLMAGLLVQVYASSSRLHKVAQEREAALASARDAVHSKNTFLGMVSHELRTPLQSMLSAIDVLELQGPGGKVAQSLQGIRRAAATLERQLRDLLALAQADAGRLEVRPEPFDVITLLENCVDDFQLPASRKGLQLRLDVAPQAPRFVVADPLRVGQVLVNLISNAIKYTAAGSVQVRLRAYDTGLGRLVIEVEDTGVGIPEAVLPRLFNEFDRLEAVDAYGDSGGIGLAVVRAVVGQLGGRIDVQSQAGQGSRFRVQVPAAQADDHSAEDAAQAATPAGRVLVVDDQPEVLSGLAAVARELGWVCDTADGAVAGLNHAAATRYDVILIDLQMPERSGRELAADIRRLPGPNQKGRLVAISASEVNEVASVFDGFELKPIGAPTFRKLFAASLLS
jgi:signal transduction histidine kinase